MAVTKVLPRNGGLKEAIDYVVADMMYFRPELFNFFCRAGFDRSSLNKPCKICPFCQPALFGLTAQQLILLCCQYDVQMVIFLVLIHIFLLPAAYSRKFFRQQAA